MGHAGGNKKHRKQPTHDHARGGESGLQWIDLGADEL
jgi:hypothetical protein